MLQIRWNYEQQWPPKIDHLAPEAIKELRQHGSIKAAEFWDNYQRAALPSEYIKNGRKTLHGRILPPLEDITSLIKEGARSALNIEASFFPARILRVNPNTPDEALIQAFKEWLQELRKFDPLPVVRPGRKGLNVRITDKHLKSWTEYKVLAVIDLDLCAAVFGVPKLSHEALCDLLLPPEKEVGPKDWGSEAREKAEEAKESIDLLIAQACSEQSPPDKQPGGTN
jgi:hypothetical protein